MADPPKFPQTDACLMDHVNIISE
eukprot:SAG31_NODE_40512_length_280_cov_0.856354_1_plen_23_part_10